MVFGRAACDRKCTPESDKKARPLRRVPIQTVPAESSAKDVMTLASVPGLIL